MSTHAHSAAVTAALLDAAVLVEQAGVGGLMVTCYDGHACISVPRQCGDARARAALVAALALQAGAAGCQRRDYGGTHGPAAWLEATAQAGTTGIEITTHLDVAAVPGGALATGPDGQQDVIAAGQRLPDRWRWVTDLDDDDPCQQAAVVA
jgi:hypothetical protein